MISFIKRTLSSVLKAVRNLRTDVRFPSQTKTKTYLNSYHKEEAIVWLKFKIILSFLHQSMQCRLCNT